MQKDFKIENSGEYHDLYAQSYTLLLADAFENSRKMFLKIYKLDHVKLLSVPRLVWQAVLKKIKAK